MNTCVTKLYSSVYYSLMNSSTNVTRSQNRTDYGNCKVDMFQKTPRFSYML